MAMYWDLNVASNGDTMKSYMPSSDAHTALEFLSIQKVVKPMGRSAWVSVMNFEGQLNP